MEAETVLAASQALVRLRIPNVGVLRAEQALELLSSHCCRCGCGGRGRRGLAGLAWPTEPECALSNLDTNKLEAIVQEIYVDLIDDSCLGFCFEVHRAVKCGYFYQEFADTGSVKDFGIQPVQDKGACHLLLCSLPGEREAGPQLELQRSPPEFQ
ncbi:ataxin-7-like protein 3B [Mus caroli]|uniref:Ataxin-7-like protein 3B n=1 Tax=Mus caroli TaxID=10089 RepID=A0A6P5R6X6_MUSCR|nr:ataxin-7-like protein 3B [Mus caroli]